jgi:ribosomal protein S18 acetylase RimI-like enzyme
MVFMMSDVKIELRVATPADIEAIVALVESAYRGESSRAGWTTEADLLGGQRTDAVEIGELLVDNNAKFILVVEADTLLGSILVRREEHSGYVGMFAVRPSAQRQGLGRRLLQSAENTLRDEFKTTRVRMTVLRQRPELISWYERRGYVETDNVEPFPYGNLRFGLPKRPDLEFVEMVKVLR